LREQEGGEKDAGDELTVLPRHATSLPQRECPTPAATARRRARRSSFDARQGRAPAFSRLIGRA
jgi:hypothetical protein